MGACCTVDRRHSDLSRRNPTPEFVDWKEILQVCPHAYTDHNVVKETSPTPHPLRNQTALFFL